MSGVAGRGRLACVSVRCQLAYDLVEVGSPGGWRSGAGDRGVRRVSVMDKIALAGRDVVLASIGVRNSVRLSMLQTTVQGSSSRRAELLREAMRPGLVD
jgi:hypothetical protein